MRSIFDEDAERYDRARPGYPELMYRNLAGMVDDGARVLEIGPGTGQATIELARRGYRVVAVELGPNLSAVARRNLAAFPAVTIHTAAFEEWPLPIDPFDVVFSATAFHWIDPAVRVRRSADALRPGGLLATVTTHHIAGEDEFFVEVQACYERFDPDTPPNFRPPTAYEVPLDDAEIVASERFGPPTFYRYPWDREYSRDQYLDLLLTYSGFRALPADAQAGLLDCIGRLIDKRGGRVVKRYLTEFRYARRIA